MDKKPPIAFGPASKAPVAVTHMLTSRGLVRLVEPVKIGHPVKPPTFPVGALQVTLD